MGKNKFKESDSQKLIQFMNLVAEKASLNGMSVQEVITFYGLLSFVQKDLLPKIQDNILEVSRVIEPATPTSESNTDNNEDS